MNLYNSYCYESLDFAAASFYSKAVIDNLGFLSSYSVTLPDSVSYIYLPFSQVGNPSPVYSSFVVRFPECSALGFDNSFFGVSPADAVLVSWAVVAVLLMAYKFKVIKKMMSI